MYMSLLWSRTVTFVQVVGQIMGIIDKISFLVECFFKEPKWFSKNKMKHKCAQQGLRCLLLALNKSSALQMLTARLSYNIE